MNYKCDTGQRMWDVYPALMALTDVQKYLGDNGPGTVTITQTSEDKDNDGINDYEMRFKESSDGYCQYQAVRDAAALQEDMLWVKKCNTIQDTVSSLINP